jgi:uncharacterized alkaline shock family protein YloU
MTQSVETVGRVTIHPSVLNTVARMTALATPGVVRLADEWALGVGRVLASGQSGGVAVAVEEDRVSVDVHVVAEPGASLFQVGQTLQREVNRAIAQMVGMQVETINVYVQDVGLPLSSDV